ncbi:uridine kinase [Naumannella cuiyingiana]|uniref:Uridine kinase n=1 Tax=Naumannella cuiyingiana TaxID=1347891 RepID=A0A7Z0D7D9_9ACTN|nr:uridine kinase [Naumannella cuiyingiana]
MSASATVVLVAGPSGSGKSRLAALSGVPHVSLDDFYLDGDHPALPVTELGGERVIDWDDPRSWNCPAAVAAIEKLIRTGGVRAPVYRLAANAAVGERAIELGDASAVVAEGVFAPQALGPLRAAGLRVVPLWLDRSRTLNGVRRLARDLAERRKPAHVLIFRGIALWRDEGRRRREALALGFRPVGMASARRLVAGLARR